MEKSLDQERKEEQMIKIRTREQELVDLRDGVITSKRSQRKMRTRVRSRVFKKYMDLWHHRPVHKVCIVRCQNPPDQNQPFFFSLFINLLYIIFAFFYFSLLMIPLILTLDR